MFKCLLASRRISVCTCSQCRCWLSLGPMRYGPHVFSNHCFDIQCYCPLYTISPARTHSHTRVPYTSDLFLNMPTTWGSRVDSTEASWLGIFWFAGRLAYVTGWLTDWLFPATEVAAYKGPRHVSPQRKFLGRCMLNFDKWWSSVNMRRIWNSLWYAAQSFWMFILHG